jgi:Chaperone of endosialidase
LYRRTVGSFFFPVGGLRISGSLWCLAKAVISRNNGRKPYLWLGILGLLQGALALTHPITLWLSGASWVFAFFYFRPRFPRVLLAPVLCFALFSVWIVHNDPSNNEPNNASAIFASTIWVAGDVVSYSGTITPSDARLKNIIGPSDSAKDLEILKKIEVTDYTMKDTVKFGQKPFKKVIAQQVDEVYPTAVTSIGIKGFTFTPDIYAVSDSIKMEKPDVYLITLAKAHDLKDGDTVRLITSKNPKLTLEAHVLNDKTFTVETKEPLGDKVFVYGKGCTDLKAVDYEAISMLNVSATQELAKKVEILEQQNSNLRNENRRLTAVEEQERQEKATLAEQGVEIAGLKAANEKLSAIAAKMESLERAVAKMQEEGNGGVRTVTLEQ